MSNWIKCSGCKTSVRRGTTPLMCETCQKVNKGELVLCQCGSTELNSYRPKSLNEKNCIRCIFLGHQPAHTLAQEYALERYQMCVGVCGLVQMTKRDVCHDCQACAFANPQLYKKLSANNQKHEAFIRDERWKKILSESIYAQIEAQIQTKKPQKEVVEILVENDEASFLQLLKFAQSGKHRSKGIPEKNSNVNKQKQSILLTPIVEKMSIVVVLNEKQRPKVLQKQHKIESLEDFPIL